MTKLAILGAAGRMGGALIRCAQQSKDLEVICAHDRHDHPEQGRDIGLLSGIEETGIPLSSDPDRFAPADALIDFSFHGVVPEHADYAALHGKGFVLGTTGLGESESDAVHRASEKTAVIWAPNMSLGVNILFSLCEHLGRLLGEEYDVEITETHHRHKKDAPSGTALGLAKSVATGRGRALDDIACYGRQGDTGERPAGQIGIHALRAGDVVGDHTVTFATGGERIQLGHYASSRDAFATGALKAAQWSVGRDPGLYDMKAVLGL